MTREYFDIYFDAVRESPIPEGQVLHYGERSVKVYKNGVVNHGELHWQNGDVWWFHHKGAEAIRRFEEKVGRSFLPVLSDL